MKPKSKFFRVAVEGATATDGRTITKDWINEMAAGFNPQTYGVRVNMEHIRGFSPQPPFNAYGDVTALKADDVDIVINEKTERRRALFAQIDPTDQLVEINRQRQKVYTSIEVAPNFASSGKAGLVGLAVTDSPASLGTEMLAFSANNPAVKAMFDARKQAPDNCFSAALETTIDMEAEAPAQDSAAGLFAEIRKHLFGTGASAPADGAAGNAGAAPALGSSPQPAPGGDQSQGFARIESAILALSTGIDLARTQDRAAVATLSADFAAFKAKVEGTENLSNPRPAAAGGHSNAELTDC